jgi:hypothetical protein
VRRRARATSLGHAAGEDQRKRGPGGEHGPAASPASHLQQRTETSPTQRQIFHALKIKEPPVILYHTTA